MRGNVISDGRTIDADDQHVTIRFKDHKAGDVKSFKLEHGELALGGTARASGPEECSLKHDLLFTP